MFRPYAMALLVLLSPTLLLAAGGGWVNSLFDRAIIPDKAVFLGSVTYSNTFWEDLRFAPNGLGKAGNADPVVSYTGGDSGKLMVTLFDAATDQELFIQDAQLPHQWKYGTALDAHFHYQPTTTATGAVVWAIDYTWTAIGGVESNAVITASITNHIGAASQWKHIYADGCIMPGTGKGGSSIINARIYRDANNAADTYPGAVNLCAFDLHYEIDKPGSPEENPNL